MPLPDESVQCVVTSPPYWGLRKYKGEQDLIWGGDANCIHEFVMQERSKENFQSCAYGRGHAYTTIETSEWQEGFCRCVAWRGAYGLEPTVEMYVAHTVEILREIRRVLRKDGVVFWNIGDSYQSGNRLPQLGLKPKDLCLIPARVALAAQQDGWWVRSRIIWAKPNPMPESVTDRPTDAYEDIILLTKSARYFWDAEAVKEKAAETTIADLRTNDDGVRRDRGYPGAPSNGGTNLGGPSGYRNMRNVWEFPTQPYSGAHFATFPEEIPRRAILAGTSSRGACVQCGAPWQRLVEPSPEYAQFLGKTIVVQDERFGKGRSAHPEGFQSVNAEYITVGWEPTCKCRCEKTNACLVLDPFGGSGTTARVAIELNRRVVLLDLAYHSRDGEPVAYAQLARERTSEVQREFLL